MDVSHILGNERVKTYLTHMVQQEKVGHSLLFAGPEGIGKSLFAEALAEHVLLGAKKDSRQREKIRRGVHPDLHVYRPHGKIAMHSIDAMRQFSAEISLPPNEAPYKVFVIHDADRMLATSANALLKTFEEPAAHTVIILLSSAPQQLLPTVLSRCRTLHFQPLTNEEVVEGLQQIQQEITDTEAKSIALQARGSLGHALRIYQAGEEGYRRILLQLLCKGETVPYSVGVQVVQQLSEALERLKQDIEEQHREALAPSGIEELTAMQRAELQKEVDGAATLRFRGEVEALLGECYAWFRDLHLLQVGGPVHCLHHQDQKEALVTVLQKAQLKPLDVVSRAVEEARISLARSTPIRDLLEAFLLKLDIL